MKNLFLLKTDKPSRLYSYKGNLFLTTESHLNVPSMEYQHIYITNDEEIKVEDYRFNTLHPNEGIFKVENQEDLEYVLRRKQYKKIILTTDQDLIADGVQPIDDEFLEWFVKNPSCEEVETKLVEFEINMGLGDSCIEHGSYYKIIIPKEEPKIISDWLEKNRNPEIDKQVEKEAEELSKQETLEEAAENYGWRIKTNSFSDRVKANELAESAKQDFIEGARWQKERSYSEEEVFNLLLNGYNFCDKGKSKGDLVKWFEQFKKK